MDAVFEDSNLLNDSDYYDKNYYYDISDSEYDDRDM